MVMPRGSESWRRMSRFRRQSLVKPLAAEVLEPRCLMTEAFGAGLPTPPLEESAAPLTGDVVIGPDLWDDTGLTLLRDGEFVHVVRTGTTQDVIAPFDNDVSGKLIIRGRDDVRDVLTIDVSAFAEAARVFPERSIVFRNQIEFDGGEGTALDELRFVGSLTGFSDVQFSATSNQDWTQGTFNYQSNFGGSEAIVSSQSYLSLRQVEQVVEDFDASLGTLTFLTFGGLDDDIQVFDLENIATEKPDLLIVNPACHMSFQVRSFARVDGGEGDDRLTVTRSSPDISLAIFGGDGNDCLIGSDQTDDLYGGNGDDTLLGGLGDDQLYDADGNDFFDGGEGYDFLASYGNHPDTHFVLGPNTLVGLDTDEFVSIELVFAIVEARSVFDASAFSGKVSLLAISDDSTLIGSEFDDGLATYGHNTVLIGGGGNDSLGAEDPLTNTFDGGAGIDTINGVTDADQIQSDGGSSDSQSDTSQNQSTDDNSGNASIITTDPSSDTINSDPNNDNISGDGQAIAADLPSGSSAGTPSEDTLDADLATNDTNVIPSDGEDVSDSSSPGDVLLIGQGIATVGLEDREWAEFDSARSDSAFGELADSEPEDDEGPTAETLADSGDLAANSDTNSADVDEELELDAALSDELLASLATVR